MYPLAKYGQAELSSNRVELARAVPGKCKRIERAGSLVDSRIGVVLQVDTLKFLLFSEIFPVLEFLPGFEIFLVFVN